MGEDSKTLVGEQPGNPAAEIFWTKGELARTVRRTTRTIENWMNQGRIPFIRIGPRTVLFERVAVLESLKKFQVDAKP
jgi:excisionase family DNA binding protein